VKPQVAILRFLQNPIALGKMIGVAVFKMNARPAVKEVLIQKWIKGWWLIAHCPIS
jgi:hypothetical protein